MEGIKPFDCYYRLGDSNTDKCTSFTTVLLYVECWAESIREIIKNMQKKIDFHTFKTIPTAAAKRSTDATLLLWQDLVLNIKTGYLSQSMGPISLCWANTV